MSWLKGIFNGWKAYLYAGIAAAFAALLACAKLEQHAKRKAQDELAAHDAERKAADAQAQAEHLEVRDAVRTEVEKMPAPSADPQPLATAPAGSAAAELRDDWSQ